MWPMRAASSESESGARAMWTVWAYRNICKYVRICSGLRSNVQLLIAKHEHIRDCRRVIETSMSLMSKGDIWIFMCLWLCCTSYTLVVCGSLLTQRLLWHSFEGSCGKPGWGEEGWSTPAFVDSSQSCKFPPPSLSAWQEDSFLSGWTTGTRGGNSWLVSADKAAAIATNYIVTHHSWNFKVEISNYIRRKSESVCSHCNDQNFWLDRKLYLKY